MTPERHRRISAVYLEALELDAGSRAAFLDRACSADQELRREVESLLGAHEEVGTYFAAPAMEVAARLLAEESGPEPETIALSGHESLHFNSFRSSMATGDDRRYKIIKKVGEGGMGEVFLAHDAKLERRVALKFLSAKAAADPVLHNRLLLEARAAAAVDHPYVCKIYEVEELEGKICLVLEYVDGQTLRSRMQQGRLPIGEVLQIAGEVAEALAEAHVNGVIHRDIKPGNIMLTSRRHVKVMDFGLAKQSTLPSETSPVSDEDSAQSGSVIGTPEYMSPEQVKGEPTDARSDIFALGIVLYEMLTGVRPFRKSTLQATAHALVHEKHEPPSRIAPEVSEALESVLDRMLAKHPSSRFDSMGQVWSELVAVQHNIHSKAPVPSDEFAVAVLPFSDLGPGETQEYFCDGLVEELINALTQVEGMRVVSRTSVLRYKIRNEDVREIARLLSVNAVLEGSVRRFGDRLRIMVKLVSGDSGSLLWSERYEADVAEIFEIQDAISRAVAEKLNRKKKTPASTTTSIQAYDQYLRGIYCWNRRTEEGVNQSIRYFENAIAFDPNYVPALGGLAHAFVTLGLYGTLAPYEVMPKAFDAADRALALKSGAAALTARGCLRCLYEWNWAGAEEDFQEAIRCDPRYALAHHWYANNLLVPLGRFDEARSRTRDALDLEPFSPPIVAAPGVVSYYERRYLRALGELREAVRVDPGFGMVHYFLAQASVQTRNCAQALESLSFAKTLTGTSPEVMSLMGYVYGVMGDDSQAQRCFEEMLAQSEIRYISPVLLAQILVGLRRYNEALDYLEKAFRVRAADLVWLNVRPTFDPIRTDARFVQICSNIGLTRV